MLQHPMAWDRLNSLIEMQPFLRNGFVLPQLDGEGMRAMQLQQEQAMKESLKDQLSKQTSQETGVNISDLRTPSNAKKQNTRINNLLRNTSTGKMM